MLYHQFMEAHWNHSESLLSNVRRIAELWEKYKKKPHRDGKENHINRGNK